MQNKPVVWGTYDIMNQATVFGIGVAYVSIPDAELNRPDARRFSDLFMEECVWEGDATGRPTNDSPEVVEAFNQLCQDLYDS